MLDHVTIGVTDFAKARDFYDKALAPLGVARLYGDGAHFAGYGEAPRAWFWIGMRDAVRDRRAYRLRRQEPRRCRCVLSRGDGGGRPRQRRAGPPAAITRRLITARSCSTPTATTSKPSATRRHELAHPPAPSWPAKAGHPREFLFVLSNFAAMHNVAPPLKPRRPFMSARPKIGSPEEGITSRSDRHSSRPVAARLLKQAKTRRLRAAIEHMAASPHRSIFSISLSLV